jgi:hypothetical protein
MRATTSVPVLPRACNDAFSKTTNVKSSATYDIPFRRRNSDVIREHPLACTRSLEAGTASDAGFKAAGVEFIDENGSGGVGVRFKKPARTIATKK